MKILQNNSHRFDFEGIKDPGKAEKKGAVKTGIAGYKCKFLGWILEKVFHKAVAVKTEEGTVYLNRNSLKQWFTRVQPNNPPSEKELENLLGNSRRIERAVKKLQVLPEQAQAPVVQKPVQPQPQTPAKPQAAPVVTPIATPVKPEAQKPVQPQPQAQIAPEVILVKPKEQKPVPTQIQAQIEDSNVVKGVWGRKDRKSVPTQTQIQTQSILMVSPDKTNVLRHEPPQPLTPSTHEVTPDKTKVQKREQTQVDAPNTRVRILSSVKLEEPKLEQPQVIENTAATILVTTENEEKTAYTVKFISPVRSEMTAIEPEVQSPPLSKFLNPVEPKPIPQPKVQALPLSSIDNSVAPELQIPQILVQTPHGSIVKEEEKVPVNQPIVAKSVTDFLNNYNDKKLFGPNFEEMKITSLAFNNFAAKNYSEVRTTPKKKINRKDKTEYVFETSENGKSILHFNSFIVNEVNSPIKNDQKKLHLTRCAEQLKSMNGFQEELELQKELQKQENSQ